MIKGHIETLLQNMGSEWYRSVIDKIALRFCPRSLRAGTKEGMVKRDPYRISERPGPHYHEPTRTVSRGILLAEPHLSLSKLIQCRPKF